MLRLPQSAVESMVRYNSFPQLYLRNKDILSIKEMSPEEIIYILDRASHMKETMKSRKN